MPSSFVIEASLAVGFNLLIIYLVQRRMGTRVSKPKQQRVVASRRVTAIAETIGTSQNTDETLPSDGTETLSNSTTGSDAEDNRAGPSSSNETTMESSPEWLEARFSHISLQHAPKESKQTAQFLQEQDVLGALPPKAGARTTVQEKNRQPSKKVITTNASLPRATRLPIHERVEQEKKRLSSKGSDEPVRVRTTAHSLRFHDTDGRRIRYALKPSKKKSRSTYLELTVEGLSPRKVRKMSYDDACHSIQDKKVRFSIPSSDAATVMKSLKLLCKVTMVRLDYLNGSPAGLKKARSNLDFSYPPANLRRVASSTNSLVELACQ